MAPLAAGLDAGAEGYPRKLWSEIVHKLFRNLHRERVLERDSDSKKGILQKRRKGMGIQMINGVTLREG